MSTGDQLEGLVLRRATRGDDPGMRALNAAVFANNPKQRAEVTRWQWWENPFGETLAWVWDDAGRVVAQTVAFCAAGAIGGEVCTFAFSVDSAVARTHQGRGLYSRLWAALARDVIEHGRVFLGYPNEESVRSVSRLGWTEVAQPNVYALVTSDRWLASRLGVPRFLARAGRSVASRLRRPRGDSAATAVGSVPEDLDELWGAVAGRWGNGVIRDRRWWRWRYDSHPDRPYRYLTVRDDGRLSAVAAVRPGHPLVGGRFHCILEMLALGEDPARAVVAALVDGVIADADGIALLALPGSPLEDAGVATGMRRVPARLHRPVRFGAVPHPTLLPDPAGVRWSVTWGDLDHL
jgi:GNAT superfamily N-acetyltransferase